MTRQAATIAPRMSAEVHAQAVTRASEIPRSSYWYPGAGWGALAKYLASSPSNPSPSKLDNPGYRIDGHAGNLSHAVLYEFFRGKQPSLSCLNHSEDLKWVSRNSMCHGSLVFLRGMSTPDWLVNIGSECGMKPGCLREYRNFFDPVDDFSLPAPPWRTKVIKLGLTTMGRDPSQDPQFLKEWSKHSSEAMSQHKRHLKTSRDSTLGESIVRDFLTFDNGVFAIEQELSISVAREEGGKWTGIYVLEVDHRPRLTRCSSCLVRR